MASSLFPQAQKSSISPVELARQIRRLCNGDVNGLFNYMIKHNPQFRDFVEKNKGKTADQIAADYGINSDIIRNLYP